MRYETLFLQALCATVAVEGVVIAVAMCVVPVFRKHTHPTFRILGAGIIPSIATLPYFWLVLPAYVTTRPIRVVIGEVSIVIIEAVLLRLLLDLPLRKCALLSLLANVASILAGLALFH